MQGGLASTWAVMVRDFRELGSLGGSRVQLVLMLAWSRGTDVGEASHAACQS